MIESAVNKDTLLETAQAVVGAVEPRTDSERAALNTLESSVQNEESTQESANPQDSKAFIPRDVALSLLQASREENLDAATSIQVQTVPEPPGPLASSRARHAHSATPIGDVETFTTHDIVGWSGSFVAALARHLRARKKFSLPPSPPKITSIADDARVILVGDWGTGESVAKRVAKAMRDQIAESGPRETHVIHLGDVYYAGTEWEATNRFLANWPVDPEDARRYSSWCLNGNHDMYSAGEGLFNVILEDPRFDRQRTISGVPTSQLHLANRGWNLIGLDTACHYDEHDLMGANGQVTQDQIDWLTAATTSTSKANVLLSHHQPFSRESAEGSADGLRNVGNLMDATSAIRSTRGIEAWFWGHEHKLITYAPRGGIGYPVCMGHGAMPQPQTPAIDAPANGSTARPFRMLITTRGGFQASPSWTSTGRP
ncbi:MAG TPA: metallophosphoesterase [Pseudonocardia sp.]|jgi:hypothetical protein|nr:metallophosphoesterase [Pseudonocardia sp.]